MLSTGQQNQFWLFKIFGFLFENLMKSFKWKLNFRQIMKF